MEINNRLKAFLESVADGALVTYGETGHQVKEVNLGSHEAFEIHYYGDGTEIKEAFFVDGGARIALTAEEIEILDTRFFYMPPPKKPSAVHRRECNRNC